MVCGGFACSKNALAALNVFYILVSFVLVGVAAYARVVAVVTSLALVGGVISCGVFLFFTALIGLIGACKHHQVLLFFYMIILFLVFLVQFSLACACLAVNEEQRHQLAKTGWDYASNETRITVQATSQCCGFDEQSPLKHPSCASLKCCENSGAECCARAAGGNATTAQPGNCPCATCSEKLSDKINYGFKLTGGIGLFFSFTEILGVWITVRYRNQKNPQANPSSFL
ncbi:tetraspanin-13-like isoform X1 [Crassostrea virginica]|uniref:Tetraspanin-13-like isoform X1 n=1 Tax=Crassostrea virginica TaxID=6565 RepID=A0A8B8DDQ9_CRAVI|nr:tetraspanin-13-like isoform X1 [Crassostrea virginica]